MRFQSLCGLIVAGVVMGVAGCDEVSFPTPDAEEFQAVLSGANEVPAVTTSATGTAVFAVTLDTFFTYRIDVATIDTPTVAHIHEGAAGVIGPIILTLYAGPRINTAAYAGPLGQNQLRPNRSPDQFAELPAGYGADSRARFDSLLALMRTGNVYVNVHTLRNGGGEIRAQIQTR